LTAKFTASRLAPKKAADMPTSKKTLKKSTPKSNSELIIAKIVAEIRLSGSASSNDLINKLGPKVQKQKIYHLIERLRHDGIIRPSNRKCQKNIQFVLVKDNNAHLLLRAMKKWHLPLESLEISSK
jgi:hypothetical protein